MSSIVSRSPPFSGSVSHAKDVRWMSMRFGTSTGLDRRAKVRRVRVLSTEAKTATPLEGRMCWRRVGRALGQSARRTKLAQRMAAPPEGRVSAHGPHPGHTAYVARGRCLGGCD